MIGEQPIVRDGSSSDLPAVAAIADAWVGRTQKPYYQGQEIRAKARVELEGGRKWLLKAELGGIPVGFAFYAMENDVAFIQLVMVMPDFQNRGVASALIREVIARHDKVGAFNDAGGERKAMYERLGFTCIDKVQTGLYKSWTYCR